MSGTERDPDPTVEKFVQRYVGVGEETVELEQLWTDYENDTLHPIPRERFKWHFLQSIPKGIERELNTFDGVSYDFPRSLNTGGERNAE